MSSAGERTAATSEAAATETRKLVLLFDGTGQVLRTGAQTNVVAMLRAIQNPGDVVVFYDPGVGSTIEATEEAESVSGLWRRIGGLAFGYGVKKNVQEGYRFLMHQWRPGDQVYVFGFSRGAYTARALVGLLNMCGLLPAGNDHLVDMVFSVFWRNRVRWGDPDWGKAGSIRKYLARPNQVSISYLGLFDTVKTIGVWDALLQLAASSQLSRLMRDFTVELPFTDALPNVEAGRHALSIDERRRAFAPRQWSSEHPGLQEKWFAGVHSDVGGGYLERELAEIALAWILDGARESGLGFRPDRIPAITPEHAVGPIHRSDGGLWRMLGTKDRKVPEAAIVDETVYQRMRGLPDYRPAVPVRQ